MIPQPITKETISQFLQECSVISDLPKETCLTLHLGNIVKFYIIRIGIHPVIESWDELRQLLTYAISTGKSKTRGKPFNIRFTGGNMPVWLVMRIYALCVFECDAMFYAGDCIIKI